MVNSTLPERLLPSTYSGLSSNPIKLNQRRIFILPTRQGIMFSVLLLTMLLGSINYNNSLAFILTFILGSLFVLAILHTFRNLYGLEVKISQPEPVFAGETAFFPVILSNYNGSTRPAIHLSYHPQQKGVWQIPDTSFSPVVTSVPPGSIQRVLLPLPAHNRGLLPIKRIRISTCFPLGLCRAWSYINSNQQCVVYPKPGGKFIPPLVEKENLLGRHGVQSGTDDFAGFRNYRAGDSIRNIAWKAFARDQGLLIKKFTGNAINELSFRWDDVQYMPDIEMRLSQLCRWIIEAEKQSFPYSLELPEKIIATGLGKVQQSQCLEALARFDLK